MEGTLEPLPSTAISAEPATPVERLAGAFLAGFRSKNTRDAYRRDLIDWFAFCSNHELDPMNASRSHVEVYMRQLEGKTRADATVARRLSTLTGFYRFAVEEGALDRSPVAHVRRPRVGRDSQSLGLDRDELARFLAAAHDAGPRDDALACLLGLNGLRVAEVCAAHASDLSDERGHRVLAVTRKGGSRALAPLAPRTKAALDAYLAGRADGPLLLASDGSPLDRHDATRIVRRLARAAHIDKRISPHSLRHSFVTAALDAGVPLRDVQDAAGHADPRTTRRYDRGRMSLDRHATYAVAAFVAS